MKAMNGVSNTIIWKTLLSVGSGLTWDCTVCVKLAESNSGNGCEKKFIKKAKMIVSDMKIIIDINELIRTW